MDAASALADLTEISSHVEAAVVTGEDANVVASTLADDSNADRLVRAGAGLLEAAGELAMSAGRTVTRLEAAIAEGSVFVVRADGDTIVATTGRAPASGLVFHDLTTCLRAVAEAREQAARKPRRAPRKKKPVDKKPVDA